MKLNTSINTGLIKITFTDEDGDIFASCRINPTDVRLMKRAEEVSEFFNNLEMPTDMDQKQLLEFNDMIEEKICCLIGYDAKAELFGLIPATSVNQEGEMWAMIVLDKITEHIKPEIEKRRQNMVSAIDKYAGKYQK